MFFINGQPPPPLLMTLPLQLGQLIMYYTPKKVLPFTFFNLPGLQKPGRNLFSDKSC